MVLVATPHNVCLGYRTGVPEYRISRAARLMGVSPDTVRRWVDAGKVASRVDAAGVLTIDGADLARLAREQAEERGATVPGQSVRNHVQGIVTRVVRDTVAALVEIQAGPYSLVALITRDAADELGLEPGVMANAVVKATSVSVELPPD